MTDLPQAAVGAGAATLRAFLEPWLGAEAHGTTLASQIETAARLVLRHTAPYLGTFPRCPVPCDADCEQPCHAVHGIPPHRGHDPEVCVATITAAAAAQERQRIIAASSGDQDTRLGLFRLAAADGALRERKHLRDLTSSDVHQRYRKKPVVIEAAQFTGANGPELARWCGGRYFASEPFGPKGKPVIEIGTLEGVMRADIGDYVIRGVKGEFYPCKPDIFEATYEPAPARQETHDD